MPVIAARNFATGSQRYLSLGAADYLRTLSIGTGWNRIRIGILYSMGTVSENAWPIRGCSFSLGVCSGVNNSASVQASNQCYGVGIPGMPSSSTGSFNYNAGTAGNSYFSVNGYTTFKYNAGVNQAVGVGSITINVPSNTTTGGAIPRRGIYILDYSKTSLVSGNLSQGQYSGAVAHMSLDITSSDLYAALEWYASSPIVQGTVLNGLGLGNSLSFNEPVNGPLDTVFLFWTQYTVPLQLYEIAVYRVG